MDKLRFQDWARAKQIHNDFVNKVLQCKSHVICTNRVKQDYAIETNDKGKATPVKLGLADKQSEGLNYEFTIVLDVNKNHLCHADKDRTRLFDNKEDFIITEGTGKAIRDWCKGSSSFKEEEIAIQECLTLVNNAKDTKELLEIWNEMPANLKTNNQIKLQFSQKKQELTGA